MQVEIFPSVEADMISLRVWMREPGILRWFPMIRDIEVADALHYWKSFFPLGSSITAFVDGEPAGIANIYIQSFPKVRHQALFVIVVGDKWRGKGVGTQLIEHTIRLAKKKFHLKILHLEVYENNPAIRLYERMGFKEYGRHLNSLKEQDGTYRAKIMMEKRL